MDSLVIGGMYKHYKNKMYRVIGTALHTETMEEVVVYEALYVNDLGQLWVRPKRMFLEEISTPDYQGPRFKFIKEI
ncbi:MAG: DUF1653 domain-containing protein [Bdellovibrionaceae bacterium]|nr:DUF1653 domain-containing protein [Pseudobdellovibrionaceae bacterium]